MPDLRPQAGMWAAALVLLAAGGADAAPDPKALQGHMEFLASDLMEGREPGTRGYDLAALYVASQFRAIGLQPAGGAGYLQVVPLRRSRIVPGSVVLRVEGVPGARFTDADHVVAYASATEAHQRLEAEAVFVGAGVVSERIGRDDYAGLDVRGRIVVVLGGPAPGLPAEVAAHLAAPATHAANAARRGALGVIVICTPAHERRLTFERLRPITRQPRMTWLDPKLSPLPGGAPAATAFIDETAATLLFAGAPQAYRAVLSAAEAGPVRGFPLALRLVFERRSGLDDVVSANVVGLLPGSDPALRDEAIVVTTHLDHIGIGPPVDGDAIYNGAIDNASGVAATLEVARALAAAPPRRSLLFVAVTAEEKGLVGSDYFAHAPTIAPERLVAGVNLDGVMAFHDFRSIVGYGVESSSLRAPLERAAASMGLALTPDPNPGASIFTQSDHYSLVRRGIPAVFLQMGEGPAPDGGSGLALAEAWDAAHLHRPSDDLKVAIDYAVFARFAELYSRFIREAADLPERPRWFRGDFFGDTFAPGQPRAERP